MQKIVIDPITRIEGHLRVEVEVDENGIVKEAWASGQLFRGLETILKGRDPRDVGLIAQRICGVCTNVHYRASISSVEDAYGIKLPQNATLVRDLVTMSLFVQDHIVHYYQLHSLDFVDVVSALEADPKKAVKLAKTYHPNPYKCSRADLENVQKKLASFVKTGRLGPFSNGYWGHKAYKFSPEQNLLHMKNYLEALEVQRNMSKAIAIFTGKTPHPQNLVVGGVTCVADILNPQRLNDFMFIIKEARDFVLRAYLPDVMMLCHAYKDEVKEGLGKTIGNFMSSGGYSILDNEELFSSGILLDNDYKRVHTFDESKITEEASRSWYAQSQPKSPYEGSTEPNYTDLNDDGSLKTEQKYSWIKAPRYDGKVMEVGPLSRMLIGYIAGNERTKLAMDNFMKRVDMKLKEFNTTIGRNAARAIEAHLCADFIFECVNKLIENVKYYDESTWTKYEFEKLPLEAKGRGLFEVPRGMLGHFICIKEGKVSNYQAVVPTTWNASPKDEQNQRGPYEEALIGIKIKNPKEPLEVLRVVHSFDPCLACAVHVMDVKGNDLSGKKVK